MRLTKLKSARAPAVLLVSMLSLLQTNALGQGREESSRALIRSLTNRSDRPDKEHLDIGLFTCGQVTADLATAQRLADLGESAIPAIEKELDVIERRADSWKYGSRWLQLAYAQIKGRDAYLRLRRMEDPPTRGSGRRNLDEAIALSLGLTSYVSDSRSSIRRFRCTRGPEPRDALDMLILAWIKNDRLRLEGTLGPGAKAALAMLLRGRTWDALRAELWRSKADEGVAVGYRLGISGRWGEPEETLKQEREWGDAELLAEQQGFRLDTFFKDGSGEDCGRRYVSFVKDSAGGEKGLFTYLVDNSDVGDLLRIITLCAGRNH